MRFACFIWPFMEVSCRCLTLDTAYTPLTVSPMNSFLWYYLWAYAINHNSFEFSFAKVVVEFGTKRASRDNRNIGVTRFILRNTFP